MIINAKTAKMYLENFSKAILDANNLLYTESDLQLGIDAIYSGLKLKQKGMKIPVSALGGEAADYIMSQYYLDTVVKPTLRKLNPILNWNLRAYKSVC